MFNRRPFQPQGGNIEMKRTSVVLATLVLALTAFAVQQSRVNLEARLGGASRGKGKAKWQTRDTSRQLQAELEVEGENLRRNSDYIVTVGSNAPFTVTTNGFGSFENEQRFLGANRPVVASGDVVTVTDTSSQVVMTGTLQPR